MTTQEVPSVDARRILALGLLLTFGVAVIIAQLFRYQIVDHKKYTAESKGLAKETVVPRPAGGLITDARGNILAMDVVEWEVSASPPYVTDAGKEAKILAPLLGLSEQVLGAALAKKATSVSLKENVSEETCQAIRALKIEGIGCGPQRTTVDTEGGPATAISATWVVTCNPSVVTEPLKIAEQVAPLLGLTAGEARDRLVKKVPWVLLATNVPLEIGESIRMNDDLGGIQCALKYHRFYPQTDLTSYILGFMNATGEGFYGIEEYYNALLRRSKATEAEVNRAGEQGASATQQTESIRPGANLTLALDLNIQYIAQEELERAIQTYGAEGGTVIVMEPASGAILAMVSYPRFDPNKYAESAPQAIFDPSVSGTWEPGSVFKLITWAAALDLGTITPDTVFFDTACTEIGGRNMCNWDNEGHGYVTATQALGMSLNVVAAQISTGMGAESFYDFVRRFGFGSLTGADLGSEVRGMVREPGDSDWFPSDLGAHAFGQGLAVTPIQMITAVSAIANGGLLVKPQAVAQIVMPEGDEGGSRTIKVEPTIVRRAISEDAARQLTDMMVDAVDGFATKAQVPGHRIAGKSSTASIPTAYGYDLTKTIASYVGFAPADDPQFVILVKLDKPTASEWGTQTAAPTFKAIAERLFLYLKIPPDSVRLAESQP